MNISPVAKLNMIRILPFGLIWLFGGIIYGLLEKGLLGDLEYYPTTGNPYDFEGFFVIFLVLVITCGLVLGTIEVFYLSKRFTSRSLLVKITFKTFIYLTAIIALLLILPAINNALGLGKGIFDPVVLNNVFTFFKSYSFWTITPYLAGVIGISLFYSEVATNLGYQVLNNFLLGKYHQPKTEDRIFMFVDMKSSTTIAEKLGHGGYFELLQEYYRDISPPILRFMGEIYQYVGDEIIVSWKVENGLKMANCIGCFFAMKDALIQVSEKYKNRFGWVPEFKGAMHIGTVTVGEIGVIKHEIIFTGDVLNTTARIQGLCNALGVELLISDDLIDGITENKGYHFESMGNHQLRGRDERINLYTVTKPQST